MKSLTKTIAILLVASASFFATRTNAQSILNPADPLITYNSSAPPTEPAWGTIGKWVRTKRLSYNTDSWKAYIYKTIPFRLKFPKTYNPTANDGKKYPMMVFWHGAGESGTKYDNEFSLANGGPVFTDAVDNGAFDGYVLIMQMPGSGWSQSYIDFATEIAEYMFVNNKLDPFRIITNGLSAGAGGCWDMLIRHPNYVAACLPMSGIGVYHKDSINIYKYTPLWYFQGGLDHSPDPNTALEVKYVWDTAGSNYKYTLYPQLGHGTWSTAWQEPDFFPFCVRAYASNPWPLKGRTQFCPGDPIYVRLGVAPYYSEYQWRKDGVIIPGATANYYDATAIGVYDCRIRKGIYWSDWSPAPVTISLKAPTVTPPITINGLMSKVIPALDTNKVSLKVPTGYASYLWQKVGNGATIGTDSVLSVSTAGDYIVKVTEQFGCSSSFSAPFTVIDANGPNKPSPAGNLIASTLSKTSIRLDWSDNPAPQFNETGYEIYQSTQAGSGYKLVGITISNAITYVASGLTPKVKYYFKVRAVNNSGAAAASNEASATTDSDVQPPTAPGNLVITTTSRYSVSLSWTASTDDIGVARYEIYVNGVRSYPTTATSYTIGGLTPKTSYTFTVRAIDVAGNQSPFSNQASGQPLLNGIGYKYYTFSDDKTVLPDFSALIPDATGVMANFALTPRTQDDRFMFLYEGYINVPTSGTYSFRTNSDDGSRLWLGSLNGVLSPYSFSGTPLVNNDGLHGGQNVSSNNVTLTAGIYPIAVAFFEQTGGEGLTVSWRTPSSGSSYVTIPNSAFQETAANNGSAPAAPSNFAATAVSYKRINLTWTDNSNNETGFEVWRSTNANSGFAPIGTTAANATSFADSTGLTANTAYYYQLRAIGQYGESAFAPQNDAQANWKFNNDYTDATGNQTLSPNNAPTFSSSDKQEGTHSVDLNGTDEDMDVNTSSGDFIRGGYTAKTITFWMRADNTSTSHGIFDFGGSDDGLAMLLNGNVLSAGIASNNVRRTLTTAYTSTGWNHIALVYSTNTLRLYVNGVEVTNNTSLGFTSVGTTSDASRIGDDNGTDALNTTFGQFDGRFDDFYVFGRALTATEINAVKNLTYLQVSATTAALPALPTAPTGLVASGTSSSSINVTWADNANNETNYELWRSNNTNAAYIKLATLNPNTTSFADTGLFSNSIYYYKVRAVGVGGNSAYSNEDSAKSFDNPPVITAIPNKSMHYSATLDVNITATDVDAGYLTLNVTNLPAFATFQQTGSGVGTISFNPSGTQGIFNNITVGVTDPNGGGSSTSFNLTVNDNYSPTVSPVSDVTMNENETVNVPLSAQDQNAGDILTFSVANVPNGFTITPGANGSATLTLQPNFAAAGTYTVDVNVSDGNGGTGKTQFTLTIGDKDPNTRIYTRMKYANDIGAPWNTVTGINTQSLKDEFGNTTTAGLVFQQPWWMPFNAGPTTGNNSGVYPDAVMNDFWYFGYYGGPETAAVAVTGLNPAKKYNLTFYGGSVYNGVADNGTTNYTVGSKTVSLYVQNNTQNTVSIANITPAADGSIMVNMTKAPGTPIGYLNALVITQVYDDGTGPAAPKALAAQYVSGQGVKLTWQDAAYNESGYLLYRSSTPGGPFTLVGSPDPNATNFTDGTVSGATQYYYKLRAYNSYDSSAYSNVVSILTANRVPSLAPIADVQIKNNQTAQVNITATDDATDHITLSVSGLPSFASFVDNGNGTGVINITPNSGSLGAYTGITVTAKDNSDSSRSTSFSIFVSDANVSQTYINFTRDDQIAGAPWNNVIAYIPYAGFTLSNLTDDGNNNTGMSITLTDAWDGISVTGTRPRNGRAIYPEQVTREGIYFANTSTHRITITGLNNAKKYNFVFFNSHAVSESVNTNYNIGATTVSLNGSYNSEKTVQINGITPVGGQVVINVTRGSGTTVAALLSAMVIQSYTPSTNVLSPTDLRVTNATTSSISLQWQDRADNETGYEVWRAPDGGSYSLLTTLGANVTSYQNTGLNQNTTYNYIVRAKNGTIFSPYSNAVKAYTYNGIIDINFNDNTRVAPAPWNNLNWIYGIGASWSSFRTETGVPTNIGMIQPVKVDGLVPLGVITGNNSGIYPDNVMAQAFGMFPGVPSYVKLTGLNISKTYDLTFFGSIANYIGDQSSAYTVNGKTVLLNANNNKSGTVTMYGVTPDENGEMKVYFTSFEGATFGLLSSVILQESTPSANGMPAIPGGSGLVSDPGNVVTGRSSGTKVDNGVTTSNNMINNTDDVTAANTVAPKEQLPLVTRTTVYPNPFGQYLMLSFPAANDDRMQVKIYDASGRIILQKQLAQIVEGTNIIRIETPDRITPPGMYMVNVTNVTTGQQTTLKLIKH